MSASSLLSLSRCRMGCSALISKMGFTSPRSCCPIARIIRSICKLGSFSSTTIHEGESASRLERRTSFTASPSAVLIFSTIGLKSFSFCFASFFSSSVLSSSSDPARFAALSSQSLYLPTEGITISSISSGIISTSKPFALYASKCGDCRSAFSSPPVM